MQPTYVASFGFVGGFIANFILGGLAKSYGIILEHFQDEFEAPTAIFTLTGGVLYMLMFILCKLCPYQF